MKHIVIIIYLIAPLKMLAQSIEIITNEHIYVCDTVSGELFCKNNKVKSVVQCKEYYSREKAQTFYPYLMMGFSHEEVKFILTSSFKRQVLTKDVLVTQLDLFAKNIIGLKIDFKSKCGIDGYFRLTTWIRFKHLYHWLQNYPNLTIKE